MVRERTPVVVGVPEFRDGQVLAGSCHHPQRQCNWSQKSSRRKRHSVLQHAPTYIKRCVKNNNSSRKKKEEENQILGNLSFLRRYIGNEHACMTHCTWDAVITLFIVYTSLFKWSARCKSFQHFPTLFFTILIKKFKTLFCEFRMHSWMCWTLPFEILNVRA